MNEEKKRDYYITLRKRLNDWAETKQGKNYEWLHYVLLLPDFFHLICKLMLDKEVPMRKKAKLGIALAYIMSPVDLMPEGIIGPVGFADDLAAAAYVLNDLINDVDEEILVRHWQGKGDILKLIKTIVAKSDQMIGQGMLGKLKKTFNRG